MHEWYEIVVNMKHDRDLREFCYLVSKNEYRIRDYLSVSIFCLNRALQYIYDILTSSIYTNNIYENWVRNQLRRIRRHLLIAEICINRIPQYMHYYIKHDNKYMLSLCDKLHKLREKLLKYTDIIQSHILEITKDALDFALTKGQRRFLNLELCKQLDLFDAIKYAIIEFRIELYGYICYSSLYLSEAKTPYHVSKKLKDICKKIREDISEFRDRASYRGIYEMNSFLEVIAKC